VQDLKSGDALALLFQSGDVGSDAETEEMQQMLEDYLHIPEVMALPRESDLISFPVFTNVCMRPTFSVGLKTDGHASMCACSCCARK
jgi:hypothetical protein